jgi:hypothetical protein
MDTGKDTKLVETSGDIGMIRDRCGIEESLERNTVIENVCNETMHVLDKSTREMIALQSGRKSRSLKRKLGNKQLLDRPWRREFEEDSEWERLNQLMGIVKDARSRLEQFALSEEKQEEESRLKRVRINQERQDRQSQERRDRLNQDRQERTQREKEQEHTHKQEENKQEHTKQTKD